MIIVVNDANILIDLVKLQLLHQFFLLNMEFHTTDLILDELHTEQQQALTPFIAQGKLTVQTFSMLEIATVLELNQSKTQLSPQDCSALFCAQKLNGTLITSDNNLRKFAKHQHVEVHGHFWVFDCLVENNILAGGIACEKLTELTTEINPRLCLPPKECEKRMKVWGEMN